MDCKKLQYLDFHLTKVYTILQHKLKIIKIPMATSISKPLSKRQEYKNLPETFEGKAPLGVNALGDYQFRRLHYEDRLSKWESPYEKKLRELALKFWIGSEFDIAIIRHKLDRSGKTGLTEIVVVFDERATNGISLMTGATWDPWECCHTIHSKQDIPEIIEFLLTYYNGVFFDDVTNKTSKLFFHNPLSNPTGDTLIIQAEGTDEEPFHIEDYWTDFLDTIYAKE